jgi:hypothetical protein
LISQALRAARIPRRRISSSVSDSSSVFQEFANLLVLQAQSGIDPKAAALALQTVSASLSAARQKAAEFRSQRIGIELGEQWWEETIVKDTVDKVRAWLDEDDLGKVVDLLGIRVKWTGDGLNFELATWVNLGPRQVEVMLTDRNLKSG